MTQETQASLGPDPTLADRVLALGKVAYDPTIDEAVRSRRVEEFQAFIDK